eukprot:1159974-Pelagomonas_calceolata.AAC.8
MQQKVATSPGNCRASLKVGEAQHVLVKDKPSVHGQQQIHSLQMPAPRLAKPSMCVRSGYDLRSWSRTSQVYKGSSIYTNFKCQPQGLPGPACVRDQDATSGPGQGRVRSTGTTAYLLISNASLRVCQAQHVCESGCDLRPRTSQEHKNRNM